MLVVSNRISDQCKCSHQRTRSNVLMLYLKLFFFNYIHLLLTGMCDNQLRNDCSEVVRVNCFVFWIPLLATFPQTLDLHYSLCWVPNLQLTYRGSELCKSSVQRNCTCVYKRECTSTDQQVIRTRSLLLRNKVTTNFQFLVTNFGNLQQLGSIMTTQTYDNTITGNTINN